MSPKDCKIWIMPIYLQEGREEVKKTKMNKRKIFWLKDYVIFPLPLYHVLKITQENKTHYTRSKYDYNIFWATF